MVYIIPSEELRFSISQKIGFDLNRFAWGRDLKHDVLTVPLDMDLEDLVTSMKGAYEEGLNIGHCDLTARYIAKAVPDSEIVHGILPLLQGTYACPRGEHAWVITDKTVIDPTLMIELPFGVAESLGYFPVKKLAKSSAEIFSEYDTYSNELRVRQRLAKEVTTPKVAQEEKGPQKSLKIIPFPKASNM